MTAPAHKLTPRSHSAYLAEVLILVDAVNLAEACDAISEHLTARGIHDDDSAILDWCYRSENGAYPDPIPVPIPADFEPDSVDLHKLAGTKGGAS
jgi:hypothetical protein